jgi:hypothetical protein
VEEGVMSLTAEEYQALVSAGLTDVFKKKRAFFKSMAKKAYVYAKDAVAEAGLPVRRDDVAEPLVTALKISPSLTSFLAGAKLTQKYWVRYFADLMIDELWEELAK